MLHIKKIKPLFTSIVTTGDRFEKDLVQGGLIVASKGDLKLWQRVLYKGDTVRGIEAGDMVMINVDNYAVKKYDKNSIQNDLDNNRIITYNFNWVTIDDEEGNPQECLLINDRDVLYAFEGEERDDPERMIEVPGKKRIIV